MVSIGSSFHVGCPNASNKTQLEGFFIGGFHSFSLACLRFWCVAMMFAPTESIWPFVLAYLFFSCASLWSIGCWLTSDSLRKLNPENWGRSHKKRATKGSYIKFSTVKWSVFALFILIFAVSIFGTYRVYEEKQLSSLRNWLVPANDSVEISCPESSGTYLVLGSNVLYAQTYPFAAIIVNGEPKLIVDKNKHGEIAVTLDIFDPDHKIVARIKQNNFIINPNNYFDKERKIRAA